MAENGRTYFDVRFLDDALLKTYVTPQIIAESSQYVEAVALSYGVTADEIADPTPFLVERLATLYSYMTAAQRKATFSKGNSVDNDSFALKFQMYKGLLNDLLDMLTKESFTNGMQAKKRRFPMTMSMERG